jgi:hypothetical protein
VPQLLLPKTAVKDVKLLLSLDVDTLRKLDEFLSKAESVKSRAAELAEGLSEHSGVDPQTVETAIMVCQYFLSVVADGAKPEEIVNQLVAFIARNAPEDKQVLTTIDRKRQALVSLLTPKPAMRRAMKVEYLAHGPQPTVDSFQTICDVRPVFETVEGKEEIVGYVPTILLQAKVSDPNGESRQTIFLYMTSKDLELLKEVVERTEEKLSAIRAKFGDNLLHD